MTTYTVHVRGLAKGPGRFDGFGSYEQAVSAGVRLCDKLSHMAVKGEALYFDVTKEGQE